jgi:protein required for attachment to host cells
MRRTCVVVANRARARFFVVDSPDSDSPEHAGHGPKLREVETLTDAEGALKGNDVFSESRSGSTRSASGARSNYDDHRQSHREEVGRRFAKRVVHAISALLRARATEKLVLAAEPHMLGLLRTAANGELSSTAELFELSEDLSRKTPAQIQSALALRGAFA